jgi:mono/diheme cytochrome c family protein
MRAPSAASGCSRSPAAEPCHTLRAAGASGQIGPSLDALRPTYELALTQVGGGMPAYGKKLTAAQIRDVAAFVATRAGR